MVEGFFTFESSAVDQDPSRFGGLFSSPVLAPYGISIRFGGGPATTFFGADIGVFAGNGSFYEVASAGAGGYFGCVQQFFGTCFGLSLITLPGQSFFVTEDDSLPLIAPDPAGFQQAHHGIVRVSVGAPPNVSEWLAQFTIDTMDGGIPEVADPNPDLLESVNEVVWLLQPTTDNGTAIPANIDKLGRLGRRMKGTITDGVTALLVRLKTPNQTKFTFTLDHPADGTLYDFDIVEGAENGTKLQVTPVGDASTGFYAFAIYVPPKDFNDSLPPRPGGIAARDITLHVVANDDSFSHDTILALERPPVILMGPPFTPDSMIGIDDFLTAQLYKVQRVRYRATERTARFFPKLPYSSNLPVRSLANTVASQLSLSRTRRIAGTQVDVVTFSGGGLVARAFEKTEKGTRYSRLDNFKEGDIRKLITIAAPHLGSGFANYALNATGCREAVIKNIDFAVDKAGYRNDEAENSLTQVELAGGSKIPTHTIVGISSACQNTVAEVVVRVGVTTAVLELQEAGECLDTAVSAVPLILPPIFGPSVAIPRIPDADYAAIFPGFDALLGQRHDQLVGDVSQRGAYPQGSEVSAVTHGLPTIGDYTRALCPGDGGELRSTLIREEIDRLLGGSMEEFDDSIP